MSKKKKDKKKDSGKPKPPEKPVEEEKEQDENPFDFGGLPQRDLKKNLGCG